MSSDLLTPFRGVVVFGGGDVSAEPSNAGSAGAESIGISSEANYQFGEENAGGLHLIDSLDIRSQSFSLWMNASPAAF